MRTCGSAGSRCAAASGAGSPLRWERVESAIEALRARRRDTTTPTGWRPASCGSRSPGWWPRSGRSRMSRGYDPRECVLMAFGGAGPMHATTVADEARASTGCWSRSSPRQLLRLGPPDLGDPARLRRDAAGRMHPRHDRPGRCVARGVAETGAGAAPRRGSPTPPSPAARRSTCAISGRRSRSRSRFPSVRCPPRRCSPSSTAPTRSSTATRARTSRSRS